MSSVAVFSLRYDPQMLKRYTEHMEEDEETTKAIPPWVELEYAVSRDA